MVLLALAAIAIMGEAWLDTLIRAMHDEEVQYVLVAPFFIAWLAWVRRARIRYCRPGGEWVGLLFVIAGWAAWSYGYRQSAPTLYHGGPVLVLVGVVVCVTGIDLVCKFLPCFALLPLLVPITPTRRQIVAAPLEAMAATSTRALCELLGLHVTQAGNLLSVNGVSVEVAEACNGMRQIITFWLLCYVVAFTQPLRWYARAAILTAVPLVAVASNVARLVPTVWVYSFGSGETAQRFHDFAGWAMLLITFGLMWGALKVLEWAMVPLRRFQRSAAAYG